MRGIQHILWVSGMIKQIAALGLIAATLLGCGQGNDLSRRNVNEDGLPSSHPEAVQGAGKTIWEVFRKDSGETRVEVNRYLWAASLDVLDFLPVEAVDPFTGVIVTGYGTPPGGRRSYRATVHISDPALDARSLKLALYGRGGAPVSAATVRAVEDAIFTRARQLRGRDSRL